MFRIGILLSLTCAEICLCPTVNQISSSDYWSSSEEILYCSPELCDTRFSTTKLSTTMTTAELTTSCVAVPTVKYTSEQKMTKYFEPEVCFKMLSKFELIKFKHINFN